jgi:hypothetical protein
VTVSSGYRSLYYVENRVEMGEIFSSETSIDFFIVPHGIIPQNITQNYLRLGTELDFELS